MDNSGAKLLDLIEEGIDLRDKIKTVQQTTTGYRYPVWYDSIKERLSTVEEEISDLIEPPARGCCLERPS
jgi:hypothetical protein